MRRRCECEKIVRMCGERDRLEILSFKLQRMRQVAALYGMLLVPKAAAAAAVVAAPKLIPPKLIYFRTYYIGGVKFPISLKTVANCTPFASRWHPRPPLCVSNLGPTLCATVCKCIAIVQPQLAQPSSISAIASAGGLNPPHNTHTHISHSTPARLCHTTPNFQGLWQRVCVFTVVTISFEIIADVRRRRLARLCNSVVAVSVSVCLVVCRLQADRSQRERERLVCVYVLCFRHAH